MLNWRNFRPEWVPEWKGNGSPTSTRYSLGLHFLFTHYCVWLPAVHIDRVAHQYRTCKFSTKKSLILSFYIILSNLKKFLYEDIIFFHCIFLKKSWKVIFAIRGSSCQHCQCITCQHWIFWEESWENLPFSQKSTIFIKTSTLFDVKKLLFTTFQLKWMKNI